MRKWIKSDNGRLLSVVEFDNGTRVEIPINSDGSVKWLEDIVKKKEG